MFPLLETAIITSLCVLWGKPDDANLPNLVCRGDLILGFCAIDDSETILPYLTWPTVRYWGLGLECMMVDKPAPLERFPEARGSLESIPFAKSIFGED